MIVLVILNKGFKEQNRFLVFAPLLTFKESAISTGLFSFVLAQVTRVFFQQSGSICKILEEGILGNICETPYIF